MQLGRTAGVCRPARLGPPAPACGRLPAARSPPGVPVATTTNPASPLDCPVSAPPRINNGKGRQPAYRFTLSCCGPGSAPFQLHSPKDGELCCVPGPVGGPGPTVPAYCHLNITAIFRPFAVGRSARTLGSLAAGRSGLARRSAEYRLQGGFSRAACRRVGGLLATRPGANRAAAVPAVTATCPCRPPAVRASGVPDARRLFAGWCAGFGRVNFGA